MNESHGSLSNNSQHLNTNNSNSNEGTDNGSRFDEENRTLMDQHIAHLRQLPDRAEIVESLERYSFP
jgi:hypothetical protein